MLFIVLVDLVVAVAAADIVVIAVFLERFAFVLIVHTRGNQIFVTLFFWSPFGPLFSSRLLRAVINFQRFGVNVKCSFSARSPQQLHWHSEQPQLLLQF